MNIIKIGKDNNQNENKALKNLIEFQDYYLIKDSNVHKILVGKRKNDLIFKSQKYELKLNNSDLNKVTKYKCNNIDEAYKFIINLFEQNKIIINEITVNKSIKLKLNLNLSKDIEIILLYNKENKDLVINELNNNYNELKNDINNLKDEINKLRKDIINLKINNNNDSFTEEKKQNSDITDIQFSHNLVMDSFSQFALDNTFTVFKSINDILYLIYTNNNSSIISFDLIDNKKIIEIKNAHEEYITNFRHYLDKINKRDLLLSISGEDNNIKLWNMNDYQLLQNIKDVNKSGFLDSACFLNDNLQTYIVSSSMTYLNQEFIKIFDLEGNKVKEINNSDEAIVFIDSYFDQKLNKNYIISGNYGFSKSYDFSENKVFHKYYDDDNKKSHDCLIINEDKEIVKLICTTEEGNIKIWNFYSGQLINKFQVSNNSIYGACLWNNDYIFVGCKDKTIKLVDIKSGKFVKDLIGHNNYVLTIKKVFLPKYGECLLSQGWKNGPIKIWTRKIN